MNRLDFFARRTNFIDHAESVWKNFPAERKGFFYVSPQVYDHALAVLGKDRVVSTEATTPPGNDPIITYSYGDMIRAARNDKRKLILSQHGVGFTFGTAGYADGGGRNNQVNLFIVPNEPTKKKVASVRSTPCEVTGVPKLDWIPQVEIGSFGIPADRKPVICVSFHWGGKENAPPETGGAWSHFESYLPSLNNLPYRIIAHGHPLAQKSKQPFWEELGIEYIEDFNEVCRLADVYVNDASSTMYEFLLTGKPVVVMNAPWFRRGVHFGIRFWDYSNVGIHVDNPKDLPGAIKETLDHYQDIRIEERKKAVDDLFPHRGEATGRTVGVLVDYLNKWDDTPKQVKINASSAGILYMCFGERAKVHTEKSIQSVRKFCGDDFPVVTLGDQNIPGVPNIEWTGECPFDTNGKRNFQFLAGRVKPFFYNLSPFERTLYMDVDTTVKHDIRAGFNFLDHWDFAVAQERLSISKLYNRPLVAWEHDMEERDQTVTEYGGNGHFQFLNSGVFFWKRNDRVSLLFEEWYNEWKRFQRWDEQAALMRAINKVFVKVLVLSESWNYPDNNPAHNKRKTDQPPMILHLYGRGVARTNK